MQVIRILALIGVLAAALPSAASADVQVSIANGRVSIIAKDATVRQILSEWSRVGQMKIVNIERIPGSALTIELKDMPEDQALDLLLRSVSGYLAAPRQAFVANASRFDRVVIMATAAVPRSPNSAAAPQQAAQPLFNPVPQPLPDDNSMDDQPVPANAVPSLNPRGPIFNSFPQPQVVSSPQGVPGTAVPSADPQDPQPDGATPTAFPGTVSVPGMIAAPPPPQPGQQPSRR